EFGHRDFARLVAQHGDVALLRFALRAPKPRHRAFRSNVRDMLGRPRRRTCTLYPFFRFSMYAMTAPCGVSERSLDSPWIPPKPMSYSRKASVYAGSKTFHFLLLTLLLCAVVWLSILLPRML
ncbi:MAG: hypothetical protein ACYCUK_10395, partial [Thiomonas sp.]